ncbi:SDR family oxidoreductase [Actinomadura harenae]|uniref:SDR family oxidoreductase n=1 Tax=Actinomadura harenae TaxID=2483351 RepID=A0A3M2LAV0_9ACTN|nr:SDR family oxidoreductase [Actinomadura harenae]RMI34554.1 SDR family oxidoreductase [Actinomadura harenae]
MARYRTALVTGAASRIGAALAAALAADGYTLHLHTGHDQARLHAKAQTLRARYGAAVTTHVVDLADQGAVSRWSAVLRDLRVDLLVNNASAFPATRPLSSINWDDLHHALAVHLLAPLDLVRVVSRGRGGHVVNVLDARLRLLDGQRLDYELAKHTLAQSTLLLAKALAPKVRVNALAPGLVLPPVDAGHGPNWLVDQARERAVLQRPARLDDLSMALRFLEHAISVTGQVINVDSGEHLGPRR